MKERFTLTVYTENHIGILHTVSIIFTRRHINIESITASKSKIPGVHCYTIVIEVTEDQVKKVTKQLQKQVEVVKAFYYRDDEVVYQELALFKLPTKSFTESNAEDIIRNHSARVLGVTAEYVVVEKAGYAEEIQALFDELEPYTILQYTSSGRVAVAKRMKRLESYLKELGKIEDYSLHI